MRASTGANVSTYANLTGKQVAASWYQRATFVQTLTGTARTNTMPSGDSTNGEQADYSSLHAAAAHATASSNRQ